MNQSLRNGKCCYYCRRKFSEEIDKTKDHIVAKCRGGFNCKDNLADCCFDCNQWKGGMTLEQWLDKVTPFHERGKHRIYKAQELGQIVGNIRKMIQQLKGNNHVSFYKQK